jgi:hypothetical protein
VIRRVGNTIRRLIVAGTWFVLASSILQAQAGSLKPQVSMMPPADRGGRCFRELFTQPDLWEETRSRVNVIWYADHNLNRQFADDELRMWLGMLDKWGLQFALEVGAVKPWGVTGETTFQVQHPMWDRFQSLGARIYAIAMDEPLCCVRKDLKKADEYAVEQTAQFVALVRRKYPGIRIGDIEPYPFIPLADLTEWIDALETRLSELNVAGLDFFRLDVDWANFTINNCGSWGEVKKLETFCRYRELPFSLIYWAADYPHLQRLNLADDATWYISIMRQGSDYALVGGDPDEYVIESWVGAPLRSVPETERWTFTHSVRDFCRRFVRPRR